MYPDGSDSVTLARAVAYGLAVLLAAAALAGAATVGDVRVLVVRATWGPTPDDAAALADAASFYEHASFGQLRLHLDITPWLKVYDGATCPSDQEAAKTAARAAGYDVTAYGRIVEVLPEDVCDAFGIARGNEVLLTDPAVLVHELGHTFGLRHATSRQDEYGDPFSPMGHGTLDFSAFEKLQLGWIAAVQRVDRSRLYAVGDIDAASSLPQALVVPTNAGEYWIEHRGDDPRLFVRLVPLKHSQTTFVAAATARFVVPKVFSVTGGFDFKWLDRTRPTRPRLHGLDETVLWWTRSVDTGSGVTSYRVTLDGKFLANTAQTRVTLPDIIGVHRFAVVAVDRAGNRSRPGTLLLHLS